MSIEIYAFLGSNVDGLKSCLVESLKCIGFTIELHPELDLLHSNPTGCLSVAILETPPTLKRIAPGVPLLASFGYSVTRRDSSTTEVDWPPRGVKEHSYEIYTRTSAGRSRSSYFMQAFTAAILAKETGGYVWVNGDAKAVTGKSALKKVLSELDNLDGSAQGLRDLMATLEKKHGIAEANRFGRSMHQHLDSAFDIGAFPFNTWPPVEGYESFIWPTPICLPQFQEKPEAWWSKIPLIQAIGIIFVTLGILVTVIYS